MLSGEGNENGEKTTICLLSKKTTLHMQHTFFVLFFAVFLHDHNLKLPKTSQLHVLQRKCRTCCCSLFFTCSFSPWWLLGFVIFSSLLKFSCCSSNKQLLNFCSSSLSLFFSLSFAFLSPTLFFLCIPNLWTWQLIQA